METINPVVIAGTTHGLAIELSLLKIVMVILALTFYFIYILSMLRGNRPPRSTMILWFILDVVAFLGRLKSGVLDVQLLCYVVGMTVVVSLITVKYGRRGWSQTETYCTLAVGFAVAAWVIVGFIATPEMGALVGTVCSIGGLAIATWPMFQGVLKGRNEDLTAWVINLTLCIVSTADGNWTGAVFSLFCLAIIIPVWHHRRAGTLLVEPTT